MAKLDHVIRCMTSRQICFPLIFMIASISLIVTSVQLSYVKPSRVNLRWNVKAQRPSENLNEDLVVDIEAPQRLVREVKQRNGIIGNHELVIEDAFPNVRVPYLQHDFKHKMKNSSNPKLDKVKVDVRERERQPDQEIVKRPIETEQKSQIWQKSDISKLNNGVIKKFTGKNEKTEDHNPAVPKNAQPRLKKRRLEPHPKSNKGVVIVTNYRSGSTFLGQLFNQHPQAFYTFEPLYPFGSNCSFQVPKRVETLRNMLTCEFPSMRELYHDIGVDPKSNHVHASCLTNNFCFRYNHEHLCTKEVCPKGNRDSCLKCGPVDLPLVNNKCRSRKVSVIKVIKLCFVGSLQNLFHDPSLDLKIIHLVRDPRGVASSRLKIHPEWNIAESIIPTCQRQAANVRAGRNEYWLNGRYKLVRYEDLAAKPLELAKEIYDFVGLPFVDSVKNWIMKNTHSNTNAETDIRAKRLGLGKQESYVAEKDPYSTQRDSTSAMQAWRKHLSFETVSKIQQRCFEALRSLGYKDFKSEQDLLNLNLSAVL